MDSAALSQLAGTRWEGPGELWLDPLGDQAIRYESTLRLDAGRVIYTWSHEGKEQEGRFVLEGGRVTFADSWHQPQPVECTVLAGTSALFALHYNYGAGDGPPWGWRMILARRPSGELVLQMTNITGWGEEVRAVRMILTPTS